ncbi:hypothetical protein Vadar_001912 [Vaccinium darrowii]|uniref:Uncharacterized protein n=1 Tax=Vaccinium darrowii TaxID=229202 RepID=A0ACB7Y4B2_9ERIC|nr:hypothetical protein Vadar_001912 [Vaccinium darrowii]
MPLTTEDCLEDKTEEFGLQCFDGCNDCDRRDKNEKKALVVAFTELQMVLESVCKIHKLPLAMTWVPCRVQSNPEKISFKKGAAYARQLKLSGWFKMCLQSNYTGSELYILEFFLPVSNEDDDNILTRLSLILRTMEENFKTFKLASSQEYRGGFFVEVIDFLNGQKSHSIKFIEATRCFPTLEPLKDGGGMLQLGQLGQPMDAVNSGKNVVSETQNYILPSFEPLQNGKVAMQLDSSDHPLMDPSKNRQNVITAERNIIVVTSSEEGKRKMKERECSKAGVKIEVPLEDILKCSKMSRINAATKLEVSISTLKRLCRMVLEKERGGLAFVILESCLSSTVLNMLSCKDSSLGIQICCALNYMQNVVGDVKLQNLLEFGGPIQQRPVEDLAFAVARFIQKGGSFVNYNTYQGGTKFGRTAGGPFITTIYDYDAPIDEYGLIRQPKYGHLKELQRAIMLCERALVSTDHTVTMLGSYEQAHVFSSNSGDCAAFLSNYHIQTAARVRI